MSFLNRHPFPVSAHFKKSLVLGFAVPKEELEDLIPECLKLDLFENRLAFIAVAIVDTKSLRPKALPKIFGRDFTLIGYRIFVRYRNAQGRRLRGLYILGSETDNPAMKRLGSIFTQYRYNVVPIDWTTGSASDTISTPQGLHIETHPASEDDPLPTNSPFAHWREARRFAGPMPFTFSYDAATQDVIIVEGVRSSWTPAPLTVAKWKIPFIDRLELNEITLANAFAVENVPYTWKRGKVEKWKQ